MTPGQAAYEEYVSFTNHNAMAWKELTPAARSVWHHVATAVINQHIIESDGDCSYDDWKRLTTDSKS